MARRWVIAALVTVLGTGVTAWTLTPTPTPPAAGGSRVFPASAARTLYDRSLDTLDARLAALGAAISRSDSAAAVASFRRARVAFKRIEGLLEAYAPGNAGRLNGPMPEAPDHTRPLGTPAGFQVLESAVFDGESPGADSLQALIAGMRRTVQQLQPLTQYTDTRLPAALHAARLEVVRVVTLGLAGFDASASGDAVLEAATALQGSALLIGVAGREWPADPVLWQPAVARLLEAAAYLRANPDFATLDRVAFIAGYANPASHAIASARRALPGLGIEPRHGMWRHDAATVFDAGAFDATAGSFRDALAPEQIALGRRLFHEARLSRTATQSCATCHQPGRAFTDGRATSPLIGKPQRPPRNTPTLLNAALQRRLFIDQRAGSVEDQVRMVLEDPSEMGGTHQLFTERLRHDPSYRALFERTEHVSIEDGVGLAVRSALAAYVRSLTALNSRFDRALRGDTAALTPVERHGFTVFMGKARCGTCHFLPLFNGMLPPEYEESEPEIIGVPTRPVTRHARLSPDPGVAGVDPQPEFRGAFRVPTVRNVTLTAPYMHNGRFRTLEQVIDFYNRGGGAGIGAHVPGQTLPDAKLELTARERRALIAFMGALVDTVTTH